MSDAGTPKEAKAEKPKKGDGAGDPKKGETDAKKADVHYKAGSAPWKASTGRPWKKA